MIVKFIEATDQFAYGKFIVARLDPAELATKSAMPEAGGQPLLTFAGRRRFSDHTTWVVDLQRGTGFVWTLHRGETGMRSYLREHYPNIEGLVCFLYLPFVLWLHEQGKWAMGNGDITEIPSYVELGQPWKN